MNNCLITYVLIKDNKKKLILFFTKYLNYIFNNVLYFFFIKFFVIYK